MLIDGSDAYKYLAQLILSWSNHPGKSFKLAIGNAMSSFM